MKNGHSRILQGAGLFMGGSVGPDGAYTRGATAITKSVLDTSRTGRHVDEIFVDVVERITLTFDAAGFVLNAEVDGAIQVRLGPLFCSLFNQLFAREIVEGRFFVFGGCEISEKLLLSFAFFLVLQITTGQVLSDGEPADSRGPVRGPHNCGSGPGDRVRFEISTIFPYLRDFRTPL